MPMNQIIKAIENIAMDMINEGNAQGLVLADLITELPIQILGEQE